MSVDNLLQRAGNLPEGIAALHRQDQLKTETFTAFKTSLALECPLANG